MEQRGIVQVMGGAGGAAGGGGGGNMLARLVNAIAAQLPEYGYNTGTHVVA
jgi:hypothetical protein